jgi:peptidoglycan/LPS O-acetylase OafA/YrhL
MKSEGSKKRLSELDALRGIACLMVFFFHHSIRVDPKDTHTAFHYGYLGVDLFFIISGFVIYLTLERTKHWMDFVIHRFSRLYPAYWLCVIITFLVVNYSPFNNSAVPNFMLLFNLTMFQHWFGIQDLDLAYWTLNLELSFYVFMLLMYLIRGINYYKWVVTAMLLPLWLRFLFPETGSFSLIFDYFTFFRFSHLFGAGIVFYKVFQRGGKFHFLDVLLLLLCFISEPLERKPFNFIEQLFVAAFFLFFILLVLRKLSWISVPILLFFGRISYVLYLLHENVGWEILKFFSYIGFSNWYLTRLALLLLFTLVCHLISSLYEQPLQRVINKQWMTIRGKLKLKLATA